ncbi:hypothetical protein CLCR_11311 [Cladophialophora carrionii]|uniref:Hydroxysteroid dehydrogenase-like protein 2 n=1 Tax=Cladophialophora carrionii TaxID=86049 RepID=A0A1C1CL51_9EURO|nr:hypothetical protein CLCR_11311 [Cladophialophora carrionii]
MAASNKQVCLIIGASRGIGRQVAIDLAREGYYVVVSAKTTSDASSIPPSSFPPDPNSAASTINTVAREITEAGGSALALRIDVRDVDNVKDVVDDVVRRLGRLDVLIYNSGAIWWSAVETTPVKRFLLLQQVNPQGLYAAVAAALPHFGTQHRHRQQGCCCCWKGRIIVVSPPIYSRFFRGKTAYAMGKVGMSVLTKGLAMDFVRQGRKDMAITSIWPTSIDVRRRIQTENVTTVLVLVHGEHGFQSRCQVTTVSVNESPPWLTRAELVKKSIESAATQDSTRREPQLAKDLRHATIYSDAILAMLRSPAEEVNGLLVTDEDFLRKKGVTDFSRYSVVPGSTPRRIMPAEFPVLEVAEQDDEGRRVDSVALRQGRDKSKL